ncbi:hypothetical protein LXL04_024900 [Taraxacum kok-saghyz]
MAAMESNQEPNEEEEKTSTDFTSLGRGREIRNTLGEIGPNDAENGLIGLDAWGDETNPRLTAVNTSTFCIDAIFTEFEPTDCMNSFAYHPFEQMSVSLTRFSWWYWTNGKEKDPVISSGSSSDSMKPSSIKKKDAKLSSSSKKAKKKWQSREERKRVIDKEYDVVLVPSDGVSLSASEESSYDSDWSIGWMEPHAPDFFQSDDDDSDAVADNSFAVLVPCYRNDCKAFKTEQVSERQQQQPSNQFLNVLTNLPNGFPAVLAIVYN